LPLKVGYFEKPFEKFHLLNTDITSLYRPHSPTLPGRRYVYKSNNKIQGNKPVEVGYELSCVGLSCRTPRYGMSEPAWNPPLSMRLVPFEVNKNSFTAQQVNDLLENPDTPLHNQLTVNTLDSNYCSPEYIAQTYHHKNLVNIIRIPSNRNVWKQMSKEEVINKRAANDDNRGANSVYGQVYKLSQSDKWNLEANDQTEFGIKLSNGKTCLVQVKRWKDMLIRSKRGHSMKDKPFDLVNIRLTDGQTGQPLFKKQMWLCVFGQRRTELNLEEIYWAYRNRYDIEHFFRFGKQKLLLDKYQTPIEENLGNWMEVVKLTYWLLFVGKQQAKHQCCKKKQKKRHPK